MFTRFIIKVIISALAVVFASYIITGIQVESIETAIIVAIVLALLNNFIKPVLIFLTLPITILTLGLFLLVINILIVKWTANLVDGFDVSGWFSALLFSLVVSVVTSVIESVVGNNKKSK